VVGIGCPDRGGEDHNDWFPRPFKRFGVPTVTGRASSTLMPAQCQVWYREEERSGLAATAAAAAPAVIMAARIGGLRAAAMAEAERRHRAERINDECNAGQR
jgi:hypothetical protein